MAKVISSAHLYFRVFRAHSSDRMTAERTRTTYMSHAFLWITLSVKAKWCRWQSWVMATVFSPFSGIFLEAPPSYVLDTWHVSLRISWHYSLEINPMCQKLTLECIYLSKVPLYYCFSACSYGCKYLMILVFLRTIWPWMWSYTIILGGL